MPITRYNGAEQPTWSITWVGNGSTSTDFSTGWTFSYVIADADGNTLTGPVTSGITGYSSSRIDVTWPDLSSIEPNATERLITCYLFLTATHATYGDIRIEETLQLKWAP